MVVRNIIIYGILRIESRVTFDTEDLNSTLPLTKYKNALKSKVTFDVPLSVFTYVKIN